MRQKNAFHVIGSMRVKNYATLDALDLIYAHP